MSATVGNPPPPNNGVRKTINCYSSEIKSSQSRLIWKIQGAKTVDTNGAWEAANCNFRVKDLEWNLSLTHKSKTFFSTILTDKVFIRVKLLTPIQRKIVYRVKVSVINTLGLTIYKNRRQDKVPVAVGPGATLASLKDWEILNFNDFFNFNSMLNNGNLHLLVELILHHQDDLQAGPGAGSS